MNCWIFIIVIIATLLFIIVPAILFFIFEFTDIGLKASYTNMALGDKILNALFMSITPRTAGFYSVDITKLSPSGQILTDILMFIGGNSGSTAGGIKITTVVVIFATLFANAKSQEHIVIFNRKVSPQVINQAIALAVAYVIIIFLATLIIGAYEPWDVTFKPFRANSKSSKPTLINQSLYTLSSL